MGGVCGVKGRRITVTRFRAPRRQTTVTVQGKIREGHGARLAALRVCRVVLLLTRVAIGGLFLAAGLSKLYQPYDFLGIVYRYELVGPSLGLMIARGLPWLELTLGVLLTAGILRCGAWLLAVVSLCLFTYAKAVVVARGLPIPCGCFGWNEGVVTLKDLYLTATMLVASAVSFCVAIVGLASRRGHKEASSHIAAT